MPTGLPKPAIQWDGFLVLSNQGASAAVWPIKPLPGSVLELVTDVERVDRIRWLSIDNVDKVTLVPTRAVSPKHVASLVDAPRKGIHLKRAGPPIALMK